MQRPLFLLLLFLTAFAFQPAKAENPEISPTVTQGGLTCFTITPPEEPRKDYKDRPSCDDLCGKQGAACSGVTNGAYNPPTKCEDPPPRNAAVCRCCKVK